MPSTRNDPSHDEQLLALYSLKARYSYMFTGRNIGFDFYRGWLSDFVVACDQIDQHLGNNKRGFRFVQIKEKYGWARYYWTTDEVTPVRMSLVAGSGVLERELGVEGTDEVSEQISKVLLTAEQLSMHKCIVCASPGEVGSFGGWLVCACKQHGPDVVSLEHLLGAAHLREAVE